MGIPTHGVRLACADHGGCAQEPQQSVRIGFTELDRVALTAGVEMVSEDAFVPDVQDHASALVGSDADGTRLRTVARMLALEKARLQFLLARQGVSLEGGHAGGAMRLDKLISSSSKRLATFIRLHREELRGTPPGSLIMVANAERVTVGQGG